MDEAHLVPERGVLTASSAAWDLAVRRAEVIGRLAELDEVGHRCADAAAVELGLSRRQVYVLLRRWRQGEGVVSDMLPGQSSGGRGREHLPEAVEAAIREVLRTRHLTTQRRSMSAVHREVARLCRSRGLPAPSRGALVLRAEKLDPVATTIALLAQPKASVKAIATLLGVSRSTLYTHVPQLAAIRAKARTETAAVVPTPWPPVTRASGAWWEDGDFALDHNHTGWQLTHPQYPAGADEAIPVDDHPPGSARLRRTILAAQAAAATVITDLTGRAIDVWEEDEDGVGDPYGTALLVQDPAGDDQGALDATLARLPPDRRPGPPPLAKYDQLLTTPSSTHRSTA